MSIQINNQFKNPEFYQTVSREHHSEEGIMPSEYDITIEHLLEVYINDVLSMRLVCTTTDLPELVIGRLLTEGVISSADDVEMLYICEQGLRAKVFLKEQAKDTFAHAVEESDNRFVPTTASCCTGNQSVHDFFHAADKLEMLKPIEWKKEWIYALSHEFNSFMPIFDKTHGTHCAYLVKDGNVLCKCEDLGRHNAVDKVIGYALLNDIDLSQCILFSSGRLPIDMVIKIIRARIPIVVTKAVPTNLAVEYAKQYHLTMICRARNGSFDVYTSY